MGDQSPPTDMIRASWLKSQSVGAFPRKEMCSSVMSYSQLLGVLHPNHSSLILGKDVGNVLQEDVGTFSKQSDDNYVLATFFFCFLCYSFFKGLVSSFPRTVSGFGKPCP